jgi:hypothetical protein
MSLTSCCTFYSITILGSLGNTVYQYLWLVLTDRFYIDAPQYQGRFISSFRFVGLINILPASAVIGEA